MLVPWKAANWSYGDPPGSEVQLPSACLQLAHCCQPDRSTPMPLASPKGYVTSADGTSSPAPRQSGAGAACRGLDIEKMQLMWTHSSGGMADLVPSR